MGAIIYKMAFIITACKCKFLWKFEHNIQPTNRKNV